MNDCYFSFSSLKVRKSVKKDNEQKAEFHFQIKTKRKVHAQARNPKNGKMMKKEESIKCPKN